MRPCSSSSWRRVKRLVVRNKTIRQTRSEKQQREKRWEPVRVPSRTPRRGGEHYGSTPITPSHHGRTTHARRRVRAAAHQLHAGASPAPCLAPPPRSI